MPPQDAPVSGPLREEKANGKPDFPLTGTCTRCFCDTCSLLDRAEVRRSSAVAVALAAFLVLYLLQDKKVTALEKTVRGLQRAAREAL